MAKPRLVVFDLDYTLWPFWIDTHPNLPLRLSSGKIVDRSGKEFGGYPDASKILQKLQREGIQIAVASRTTCGKDARSLVKLLGWEVYFCQMEIYPGSKVRHFNRFHAETGVPYKDMLFFDDEDRNIDEVSQLGVTCILADEGMSSQLLDTGLQQFKKNQGR